MAAKGIFVFVSLCLIAFAIGKPQNQVIMLIMSHNCYTVAGPNLLGKKPATRMPKYKHVQIPDVTPPRKLASHGAISMCIFFVKDTPIN